MVREMRYISYLMILSATWLVPSISQSQPVWTSPTTRSSTFTFGDTVAQDMKGYVIGRITNLVVTLVEQMRPDGNLVTSWNVDFDFYNGCCMQGTRGSIAQDISFELINTGPPFGDRIVTSIDIGHCIYGKTEHQHKSGIYNNYIDLVSVGPPTIAGFGGSLGKC